jgi:CDP-6-deoxy-D-xylo-4-hexulose-3-dehydrase
VQLEEILKKQSPKALILVSTLGMPPDMEDIEYLCKKYNCLLLEDNCEGLGSRCSDSKLGTFGIMSTTSLYWGHHISTIEGGMVFTNDDELYDILRMVRAHGWDRNIDPERAVYLRTIHEVSEFNSRYTFYYPGYNFRPTELSGALGIRQMLKIDEFIRKREQNFKFYQYYIKNNYWKPDIAKENFVSNLGYPIIHPKRDRITKALTDAGVECRPFISGNMARQPFVRKWFIDNKGLTEKEMENFSESFKNAEEIHKFGMYVPNHPFLKEEDLYLIYKTVNKVIDN